MRRYKYLLKNIGLLTLSSFATKLLSFLLVPLYTNILSTTDFGIYDLFNTTIGVLIPILTLNIQEAVMRFAMDKKYDKMTVISIGMKYFFIGTAVVLIGLTINFIFVFSNMVKEYAFFFFLMYISQSFSGVILAYTRGIEHIAELSFSSVVNSLIVITCNIVFLSVFRWGLTGYFLANIVGFIFQNIYLLLKTKSIGDTCLLRKYSKYEREMLTYSKPMIANSIAWWVNNASDRYIVIYFCGLAENGIYSVASKIPSILNVLQGIFSQAWTLSAVKDFDKEDKDGFFANTYKSYNCLLVIICSLIIVFDKILARILYAKDFFGAWKYVPWLSIAIVFGALSGYIGGLFSAVKNSKIFAHSTIIGAIANITMNLIFTPIMGTLGAAIATTICFFITWIFRYIHSKRIISTNINIVRDVCSYIVLIVQSVIILMVTNCFFMYSMEAILLMIIIGLYINDFVLIVKKSMDIANTLIAKLSSH